MNAKPEKTQEKAAVDNKRGKKASTTDLPMVDLDPLLGFVDRIEGEGLQTLSQQDVAKRLGYANLTSTPFYRRVVAAKLFGLLDTTQGVNLGFKASSARLERSEIPRQASLHVERGTASADNSKSS